MTFGEAMTAVAEGKKIARPYWELREESPFVHLVYEHATLTSGEWHSPYSPWLGDLIATDWEVIQEPETERIDLAIDATTLTTASEDGR